MEETKDEILLRNFFKIINRNKIFSTKISLIFLSIILLISFIQRRINPSFQGSTLLLIKDPFEASITDSLNSPLERSSFSDEFIDLTFNRIETDFPTLIVLLKSRKILDPIIKKHKVSHRYLTRALKITSGGQGNNFKEEARGVLDIKLNMSDAQKTKQILNDISKIYLSLSLESRQKYLSDGLSFLDNQLPKISQKTKSIQKRISNFRVTNFLVEPKNKAAAIKQREKNLDENIAILESERKRLEKIRDEIKNGTITAISFQEAINKTSSTYPYFFKSDGLSISNVDKNTLEKIIELEAQLSDAKVKFTKDSKIIRGLEKKLDMLSPNFYEAQIKSVDIALSLNSDLILNSKKQKEMLQIEFSNIPNLIMEYETLEQELKIAKENLSRLVVAKEAFLLELSQKKIPWQVISPIYVEKTQNSALGNLFLLGIIASVIIGLFAAYLKDFFDNTFKDENDIKLEFDLPLLTDIPSIKGNDIFEKFENYDNSSKILETDSRYNNYREPFVELVTAINFLNSEKIKIFSITSFLNSEGKTLMNIFLAKTLAKIGFKVLIVDLNLRFPKIHNILSIKNEFGLSNLLIDEKLKLEKVIKDFNLNNNDSFKVLTSGSNISEPIKLLNSPKFIEFSEDLRNNKKFDYVIFDMPAINGLSDFNLIAQYCDKLILLITLKQVQKKFNLMNSIKFEDIRNKFIGILINSKYVKDN